MSLLLLSSPSTAPPPMQHARRGLVRGDYHVTLDDGGPFHPLGVTLFWSLFGWKFERQRIVDHLAWLSSKGFDYVRILAEVDWKDRSIDPNWPDYTTVLREFVDECYDVYGMRVEVTIVGGQPVDKTGQRRFVPVELARTVATALADRAEKIMLYEMCNEADNGSGDNPYKVSVDDMIAMAQVVAELTPNLVSLSRPVDYSDMKDATKAGNGSSYTPHPRRSSTDYGWSHVRQGYDFKDFDYVVWNNEPEGPQSSVVSMSDPLQLACCRLLGIMCGGAGYVLHVGQGVTGEADPDHGRPENMWEVENIDQIMAVVRACDPLMPPGVENWNCRNNGRDDHPLPLDAHAGFWEGSDGHAPAVNKNYAAITAAGFVMMLTGVKSNGDTGPVPAGTAIRPCYVELFDPLTLARITSAELAAGQSWTVPGRGDTMAAYVVRGQYR